MSLRDFFALPALIMLLVGVLFGAWIRSTVSSTVKRVSG